MSTPKIFNVEYTRTNDNVQNKYKRYNTREVPTFIYIIRCIQFFTAITTTLLLLRNNKLRLILNGIHWL